MAERSPKRRRTDDTAATVSAERIAQTNASLQHFMTGQRQNRWMQGYVPPAQDGRTDDGGSGIGAGQTAGVQTGNMSGGATGRSRVDDGETDLHVNERDEEGTNGASGEDGAISVVRENSSCNLVDYDLPPTSDSPLTTFNDTMHRFRDKARGQPGLPSPASSSDGLTSPFMRGANMPPYHIDDIPRPPPRQNSGTPLASTPFAPSNNDSSQRHHPQVRMVGVVPSNSESSMPALPPPPPPPTARPQYAPQQGFQTHPHYQAARGAPQNGNVNIQFSMPAPYSPPGWPGPYQQNASYPTQPAANAMGSASAAHQRASSLSRGRPANPNPQQLQSPQNQTYQGQLPRQPPRPSHATNSFEPAALLAHIEEHQMQRSSANDVSDVDRGRLSLLRDAVPPPTDGFYVVVSQMHALFDKPDQLPEIIRTLPPECFRKLDELLAPSTNLSGPTKKFLSEFPASIASIYTGQLSTSYHNHVRDVAVFLRNLPTQWDALVADCKKKQSPPLASDLDQRLGMKSPVLAIVAFRSIARMIWSHPDEKQILDHAEFLHRRDQNSYGARQRSDGEKDAMYQVYRMLHSAYSQWLTLYRAHEDGHRRKNPRQEPPPFEPFGLNTIMGINECLALFDGQPIPPRTPAGAPATRQQASMPMQQQRNIAPAARQQPFMPSQQQRSIAPATQQQARTALQQQRNLAPQQQTPLQQQQAMVANAQRLSHSQTHNAPRVNTQSPAQPNMPQRLPPVGRPNPVSMPIQQRPPGPNLVFPHERDGPRSQPTEPNPARSAVHQAHLRSPVSVPMKIGDNTPQLYRQVCEFMFGPMSLDQGRNKMRHTFNMKQEQIDLIPKTHPSAVGGELPNRIFSEGSLTYRIRCCRIKAAGFEKDKAWIENDCFWPADLYVNLNGVQLEMRLPLQFKKHLPVDITSYVKAGENRLEIVANKTSTDKQGFPYALAVEMVNTVSQAKLLRDLDTTQNVSVDEAKAKFKKELGGPVDPDIQITTSTVTVKLSDPYSASKIFDIPVRGATCKHPDCFDLKTFLSLSKRDIPGGPTQVDVWRCPICRGDVRPKQLIKDEWLVDVRAQLAKQGKLDTRAILVNADGRWKPKAEEKTGVRSASLEAEERGKKTSRSASPAGSHLSSKTANPAPKKKAKKMEVITIEDSD